MPRNVSQGFETLVICSRLDQRATGPEAFSGQWSLLVSKANEFGIENFDLFLLEQAMVVCRDHGVVSDGAFDRQSEEPVEEQVVRICSIRMRLLRTEYNT